MKWNGTGRGLKALGVSLAIGLGMTACSRDYTLGYLYVTASRTALINAYAIDYQSGALQQLADSPIPAAAQTNANPVALAATPNGKYVYVINHDVSQIAPFAVGTDGKLYGQPAVSVVTNTSGSIIGTFPTAASIDPLGNFLFVTFTYQSGFSTALPGPGGVAVYPINETTGTLGAPIVNTTVGTTAANPLPYFPTGYSPAGVFAAGNTAGAQFLYVVDQDHTAANVQQGVLLVFSIATSGALTPVVGPTQNGFGAGSVPSSVIADRGYVYVTDQATNQLYAYSSTIAGTLTGLNASPYTTGQFPLGITIDPRGDFLYVANFGSNTVSTFARNLGDGTLSGGGGIAVDTGPTCVTVDPALGVYLFTSNNRDSSVSSLTLNPHTGALSQVQGTPFAAAALPTCAVAIANGAHPTQIQN